jgi:hypothetical protein
MSGAQVERTKNRITIRARQLSLAHVSAKPQCTKSRVRELVAEGLLQASCIALRSIRISEADLQAYLDARANVPSAVCGKKRSAAA